MPDGMLIGKVCRRTGCTPRTIRHYEAEKLLAPLSVTSRGHKLYGEETVLVIRTTQVLKSLGYSIKEIRSILSLSKSESTKEKRLTRKLRKMLSDCASRIASEVSLLASAQAKISALLEKTQNCEGCVAPDCAPCGKLKELRTLGLLS